MTNYKFLLGFSLIFCSFFGYAQGDQKTVDEKIIDSQVNRMVSDWNTHEFNNMDSYATDDVDWVNIVGMWWKGKQEVKKSHKAGFDYFFKGVPFTRKSLDIRFITSEVAIAHLVCHVGSLFPPDGIDRITNRTPETDNLLTLIYVKTKSTWLLSAGQNTYIDPKATKLPSK
ncbi:SgcJ/EcaC family oxidoreductase [Mucilaginibacter aquaedulcis]|uniref:SgcJ/EcaC family oxidoreductase n=1 Tax=Mucilaginibacter aquaedulcis TaxID=1187081 RepID=UPI0025B4BF53|nr:SgcJ/EcaC family oxidoreductase [Mucilaginibacter aquaedulcis]MDN3550236.1 SgcJ/EcaC family oxidoreductase [Mucilaginibacter aquaedulcis]